MWVAIDIAKAHNEVLIESPQGRRGSILKVVSEELIVGVGAVGMWESGAFCRISKRGGKRGKPWFGFSTLSTMRHFHSAEPPTQGALTPCLPRRQIEKPQGGPSPGRDLPHGPNTFA